MIGKRKVVRCYKKDFEFLLIHYVLQEIMSYHTDDEEWQNKIHSLNNFVVSRLNAECSYKGDIVDRYVVVEVEEEE